MLWSRTEPQLASASTTTSGDQTVSDSIYQYQQMLLVEQQRRIREMGEARRERERQQQQFELERKQ